MRRLLPALLLSTATLLNCATVVLATDYQQCETSSTCPIGEFLYNDDYTALPGQTCRLTAKYPDGSTFLTNELMTSRGDGWYSYDATTGTTEGVYSATICCTPSSGLMCLDKSFEVKTPVVSGASAADIWSYSSRTMTSYGTLVNDIWNASTRSLTTFGSLISDLWGHSTRTMTSFGTLVTDITGLASPSPSSTTTLQGIINEQRTQRELLEKLVNAPIVTLSLEDNPAPDLSLKLEESKKQASALYDAVQSTKSRLLTLDGKWNRLASDALTSELASISSVWTEPESLASLSTAWNNPVITSLQTSSAAVKTSLTGLLASATVSKSSLPPATLFTTIDELTELETVLGDVSSSSGDSTLFGYLASVSERDSLLESENQKLSLVLEDWDSQGEAVLRKRVKTSQDRLLTINEFPGGEDIITPSNPKATGKSALKNLVFSLQGLIGLNRIALASNVDAPIRGLWLEEGSIIFRAVITNPSSMLTQSAPLKFYLPKELHSEDIMTIDPDLTATYDVDQETLAVTGTFDLNPGGTKIVAVEVEDIWQLNEDELTTLKTKAEELTKTLEKSNLLSQGVVLKSSIIGDVDKLLSSQNQNVKPENRIRAYREARLALATTTSNMTQLENLVAQAGSSGSLLGFVGGAGTTAVFGIILVIVAGFVFMSTYFKKLALSPALATDSASPDVLESVSSSSSQAMNEIGRLTPLDYNFESKHKPSWQMPAIIAAVVVVTAGGTYLLTQAAKPKTPPVVNEVIVASPVATPTPAPTSTPSPSPSPSPTSTASTAPTAKLSYTLVVPADSSVNVRNLPSSDGDIIMSIKETQDVYVFKTTGDWRQIGFSESDSTKGYWVHSSFLEEK